MNYNREPDQCPRELMSRWVELTAMLYFKQGNQEQLQAELTKLMSEAKRMGLFKQRCATPSSREVTQPVWITGRDRRRFGN